MGRSCRDYGMKTPNRQGLNPRKTKPARGHVAIYKIIKEKGGVNEDVGWIPKYLKVAVEHLAV